MVPIKSFYYAMVVIRTSYCVIIRMDPFYYVRRLIGTSCCIIVPMHSFCNMMVMIRASYHVMVPMDPFFDVGVPMGFFYRHNTDRALIFYHSTLSLMLGF